MTLLPLLIAMMIVAPLFADATAFNIRSRPNEAWLTGGSKDVAWGWMKAIDAQVAGGANLGTGRTFYLDSGVTTEGNGTSWETAKDTLLEAVALCTASRGDRIKIAQGHAEAIADILGAVVDVAGITIEGIGNGSLIPTFTVGTDANATIHVTAPNVTIVNIKVISDLADCAAGITLGALADGAVIAGCITTDGAAAKELVIGISVAADCDNIRLLGNTLLTVDGGGCASAIKFAGGSDNSVIDGNVIFGEFSAAAMDLATALSSQLIINDNRIRNAETTASWAIDCHANTTGWLTDNSCGTEGGAHGDAIAAADMSCAGNVASGDDGAQGIPEPAIDT